VAVTSAAAAVGLQDLAVPMLVAVAAAVLLKDALSLLLQLQM